MLNGLCIGDPSSKTVDVLPYLFKEGSKRSKVMSLSIVCAFALTALRVSLPSLPTVNENVLPCSVQRSLKEPINLSIVILPILSFPVNIACAILYHS